MIQANIRRLTVEEFIAEHGDRFQKHLFRQPEFLSSAIFPKLRLQAGDVFATGQV